MSINIANLNAKLWALQSKNATTIVSDKIYLPFTGKSSDVQVVSAWLQRRIQVLNDVKAMKSVADVNNMAKPLYDSLCAACKLITGDLSKGDPSKILIGDYSKNIPCEKDYENVCTLTLLKHCLS